MKTKNNKSGFTLVELMIVVVIIGILIAIAIPVYSNTTELVEKRTCQANVRIINGAAVQYWEANGVFPADLNALKSPAYLQSIPTCPKYKDAYEYNKGTGIATCKHDDHKN